MNRHFSRIPVLDFQRRDAPELALIASNQGCSGIFARAAIIKSLAPMMCPFYCKCVRISA
jgi:hypothetical protein